MRNRVGYTIIGILLGASSLTAACNDDEDGTGPGMGGESSAGESSGGSSSGRGGSSNGGSNSGGSNNGGSSNGGSSNGGSNNGGTRNDAGAGGDIEGGSGGMGGESLGGEGGSSGSGAGAGGETTEGGAAGAGGAGNPSVTYACGTTTIAHKACSALAAGACDPPTNCSDCRDTVDFDREGFATCPACLAEWDKVYECAIDAHESGNLSAGVECVEGFGADYTFECYETFDSAVLCLDYAAAEGECPAVWPLP